MSKISAPSIIEKGYEAIIFDLDGTLIDSMSAHFEAWCEALEVFGAKGVFKEDVFYAMGGRPTKDIVTELNGEFGLQLNPQDISDRKRKSFLERLNKIGLIEEVVQIARDLRGKIPLGIATGGQRLIVEKTLQGLELSDLFDEVATANDVTAGKPAPDIFLEAASRLGVDPKKCLVFEDSASGIMAAQQAGMDVEIVEPPVYIAK